MGVSLRTLAKLTQPAMARWWWKRGIWILGGTLLLATALVSMILLSAFAPGLISVNTNRSWLDELETLLDNAITLCFLLCAILAAGASARACREIGEEEAAPAVATFAQLYNLALLRTWPAFTSLAAFRFLLALGGYIGGGMLPAANLSFGGVLVAATSSLEVTCGVWQVLLWLVALLATSQRHSWLAPV